jgi:serine-type D-Ala-D-Ala carboxypeptidase (penicillin-binding protein 5/6)
MKFFKTTSPIVLPTVPDTDKVSRIPVKPQLLILGALLVLLLGGAFSTTVIRYFNKDNNSISILNVETPSIVPQATTAEARATAYKETDITGKAAFVWDIATQQALYAKNETDIVPLASLTKLMTALVAHELLSDTARVKINTEATKQESASGLKAGAIFSQQALSDLILLASSNDGAYALAATAGSELQTEQAPEAFVAAMNVRAEEIGLSGMKFNNPTGLDVSKTEAGAYGSAKHIAFLMEYILKNEPRILALTQTSDARIFSETGEYIDAANTNYYIDEIPGLLGSKTGYTDLAGGNLVVAYDAGLNRPIVVVVLGSTQYDRFTDVMELIEATNSLLATTNN